MNAATTELTGANIVAGQDVASDGETFRAVDPRTADEIGPPVQTASAEIVERAVAAAEEAAPVMGGLTPTELAELLRAVATELEDLGDRLVSTADLETALGASPRLVGERDRTTGQLRAFATLILDGTHLDAIIDTADPSKTPPRPDLRRMSVPLGPVAVFGASNFPLAFGVCGGDTASALAAGCPVVFKAHPANPGTSEMCARAIASALDRLGLPAGAFSLVHGAGPEVGQALVQAEGVKAVGFTGSLAGGRALYDAGAARPEPIPVYAEMGSLNPVFVAPAALAARSDQIASGLVGSFTMGTGQFCTKPGVVVVPPGVEDGAFLDEVAGSASGVGGTPMLYEGLRERLASQLADTVNEDGVEVLVRGDVGPDGVKPTVLVVDADTFRRSGRLRSEHFGPVLVVVRCSSDDELLELAGEIEGSLTATVHADEPDATWSAHLATRLTTRVGRIVWNGYPTGVAVTHAQMHGGPYPATTAPAHTSVGTTSIRRWLRPVAWQDAPDAVLPPPLQDANPWKIKRQVDGEMTTGPVVRPD